MGKKYVSEKTFNEWCEKMRDECINNPVSAIAIDKKCCYAYLRERIGKAKCREGETFDTKIGIAYAWARCTGQVEYYPVSFQYGDKVIVKRKNDKNPKAYTYIDKDGLYICLKSIKGFLVVEPIRQIEYIKKAN